MVPELAPEPPDALPLAVPVALPELVPLVPVPPTAPDVAPVPPAPDAPAPADVPLAGVTTALPDEPVVADPLFAPVVAELIPLVPPGGVVDPQPVKEKPTTRAAKLDFENVRMNCSSTCFGRSECRPVLVVNPNG
jgi:hypothetical protein